MPTLPTSLRRACCALILTASSAAAQEGRPPNAAADSVLERLVGSWTMVGQVGGDSVRYTLYVQRMLQGRFIGLHMLDDARPAQYEARVMIGADTSASRVIAHWLDSFGAAYSAPVGYGTARGDSIQFTIAYSTGTFRDVFSANADGTWHLAIDAQTADGWRPFAAYRMLRRESAAAYDIAPEMTNPNALRSLLQQSAQRLISTYDELLGTEKRVRLRVELDAEGQIVSLGMLERSGHPAVDAEALSIVGRTRFRPAQRGGVAVMSAVVLPLRFVFPDE